MVKNAPQVGLAKERPSSFVRLLCRPVVVRNRTRGDAKGCRQSNREQKENAIVMTAGEG